VSRRCVPRRRRARAQREATDRRAGQRHRHLGRSPSARSGEQESGGRHRAARGHDGDHGHLQPPRGPRPADLRRAGPLRPDLDARRGPGDGGHLQQERRDQRASAAERLIQPLDDPAFRQLDHRVQQGREGLPRSLPRRGAGCTPIRRAAGSRATRRDAFVLVPGRRRQGCRAASRVGERQGAAGDPRSLYRAAPRSLDSPQERADTPGTTAPPRRVRCDIPSLVCSS